MRSKLQGREWSQLMLRGSLRTVFFGLILIGDCAGESFGERESVLRRQQQTSVGQATRKPFQPNTPIRAVRQQFDIPFVDDAAGKQGGTERITDPNRSDYDAYMDSMREAAKNFSETVTRFTAVVAGLTAVINATVSKDGPLKTIDELILTAKSSMIDATNIVDKADLVLRQTNGVINNTVV